MGMTEDEVSTFFNAGPYTKGMLKWTVKKLLVKYRETETYRAREGEYRPLKYWTDKGYDEDKLLAGKWKDTDAGRVYFVSVEKEGVRDTEGEREELSLAGTSKDMSSKKKGTIMQLLGAKRGRDAEDEDAASVSSSDSSNSSSSADGPDKKKKKAEKKKKKAARKKEKKQKKEAATKAKAKAAAKATAEAAKKEKDAEKEKEKKAKELANTKAAITKLVEPTLLSVRVTLQMDSAKLLGDKTFTACSLALWSWSTSTRCVRSPGSTPQT